MEQQLNHKSLVKEAGRIIRDITNISGSIDTVAADQKIRSGISFRGANAWILAFSIVIASVGLNINSVAVVIGAMLVSPLLGPIFGIGLGLGTNDTRLLKQGVKNLIVMVGISLMASFLYFLVTPLSLNDPTELVSRTSPTLYDVLIALFGGLAGIFEICRKEKGTVLSGVAIATALMPPLCTAGYGLANGNFSYFGGAMFLFIINSVFIILATYVMVKYFGFAEAEFLDERTAARTRRIISLVIILVIIPSIWGAGRLIRDNNFKRNVEEFVKENRTFDGGYIYSYDVQTKKGLKATVYVAGEALDADRKAALLASAAQFGIDGERLDVREHVFQTEQPATDVSEKVVQGIFERSEAELGRKEQRIRELERRLEEIRQGEIPYEQVTREAKTQYPEIRELSLGRGASVATDSLGRIDCLVAVARTSAPMKQDRKKSLADWLRVRLGDSTVVVLNPQER